MFNSFLEQYEYSEYQRYRQIMNHSMDRWVRGLYLIVNETNVTRAYRSTTFKQIQTKYTRNAPHLTGKLNCEIEASDFALILCIYK